MTGGPKVDGPPGTNGHRASGLHLIGTPIRSALPEAIVTVKHWRLSDETRAAIAEIERHARISMLEATRPGFRSRF